MENPRDKMCFRCADVVFGSFGPTLNNIPSQCGVVCCGRRKQTRIIMNNSPKSYFLILSSSSWWWWMLIIVLLPNYCGVNSTPTNSENEEMSWSRSWSSNKEFQGI